MLQPRRRADLGQEPFGAQCGAEIRMQDLDRDVAVVPQVVREIDRRHAARAELALDAVAVGEGELERTSSLGEWSPREAVFRRSVPLTAYRPLRKAANSRWRWNTRTNRPSSAIES